MDSPTRRWARRMDPYLRMIDRADILDKAKAALTLHQWIVEPDFDQEGEVAFQAVGHPFAEAMLLPLAQAWQDATDFHKRAPEPLE